MQYADVIIDISIEKLDKTFQYEIPENLVGGIAVGSRVIIPFGNGSRRMSGFVVGISGEAKIDPNRIKPILGTAKDSIPVESTLIALADWMHRHYGGTMNQALKTVLPIKKKEAIKEKKHLVLRLDEKRAKEEYASLIAKSRHSLAKERLLLLLMEKKSIAWDYVTKEMGISSAVIRDFEKNGWISVETERIFRNPVSSDAENVKRHTLNESQKRAVDLVEADILAGKRETYLLYGVTGSGKTEVYMELIEKTIGRGESAIVLIPEISLTYQTLMRFYARFGDVVSILNSRMSPGERFDQFERAKSGQISIMVGPRSALFTPFSNLGLIIIDEEHEPSYKSEVVPRYHARETAIARARMQGAAVVLGSATPSVESFALAKSGKYKLLELPERVSGRALPECEIVDLRQELREGNRSVLSRRLQELMKDRLEKKEQIMLFINRRGLLGFVSCRACGHVIKCPHCDVSLSLHRGDILRCHYCGYETKKPSRCPDCGSAYIGGFKAGTQKFEEIVAATFPEARILRMDMDTTRGKNGHEKILSSFAKGEADILIGTQMIVKGHDFSNVTLVGILAADMSLNASDYHCGERTFQLLTQAAGRAGRGDVPGRVVLQTYQPDHYSIVAAKDHDYASFYEKEIAYRLLMDYPPAGHLLMVLLTSEDEEAVSDTVEELAGLIQKDFADVRCLGASDAAVAKVKDIYRKVIYCKDPSYDRLIEIKDTLSLVMQTEKKYAKVLIWFDFDPMNTV